MGITIVFICYLLTISIFSMLAEADTNGFTIDLIHRDSPQSPSYDSSLLPSQRSINALRRSFNRLNRFRKDNSTNLPVADIIPSAGEFFMRFSIGTPPFPILAIFDTGSDLIWTQCLPCIKCFKQKYPIFVPRNSSTYKHLACNSAQCNAFRDATCDTATRSCVYSQLYGDGSYTSGDLATETITLDSNTGPKISISNVFIGCGDNNDDVFSIGESGIAGFGSGNVSLISQLGSSGQGKFSYCLVSILSETSNSSKLNFGNNAVVSGEGVVSTPIVSQSGQTFYYLILEGISVGNQRFEFFDPSITPNATQAYQEGNIIIDSGTTLTILPSYLYNKLEKAIASSITLRRINDPNGVLNLCYSSPKDIQVNVPDMTFHFKGADVKLNAINIFVRQSDQNALCFAFLPEDDVNIYGNLAQVNFLIGFDLNKKTVSFKPTDCSKS